MKIKNYKCKCGHDEFFMDDLGSQTGIYCSLCGKWLKWADKNEKNLLKKKVGKWCIAPNSMGKYCCGECGSRAPLRDNGTEWLSNFCPNCGKKMGE